MKLVYSRLSLPAVVGERFRSACHAEVSTKAGQPQNLRREDDQGAHRGEWLSLPETIAITVAG